MMRPESDIRPNQGTYNQKGMLSVFGGKSMKSVIHNGCRIPRGRRR